MSYTIEQCLDKEAPQFVSDPDKDYFMTQAELYYSEDAFGTKYNLLCALQAAHDMTIRDIENGIGAGSSGTITSKTEMDQSISFGSGDADPTSPDYLKLTRYGRKILFLKRTTILSMKVSGSNESLDNGCCFLL